MKKLNLVLLLTLLSSSCSQKIVENTFSDDLKIIEGEPIQALNTFTYIHTYVENDLESVQETFSSTLWKYAKLLDRYHNYSSLNNLKTINDSCGSGEYIVVDKDLYNVIKDAYNYTISTNGLFNLCIGEIADYYNSFINEEINQIDSLKVSELTSYIPKYSELDNIIEFNEENSSIKLNNYKSHSVSLSLGGIGKGYIVDKMVENLSSYNYPYIISSGTSSITMRNKKLSGDGNYVLGLTNPIINDNSIMSAFTIEPNLNVSTSGDQNQCRFYNNDLIHHIVNPKDGSCNNYYRSVSLVSSISGETLDCLTTAIFNTDSYNDGINLIKQFETTYGCEILYCFALSDYSESSINYESYNVIIDSRLEALRTEDFNSKCSNVTIINN